MSDHLKYTADFMEKIQKLSFDQMMSSIYIMEDQHNFYASALKTMDEAWDLTRLGRW